MEEIHTLIPCAGPLFELMRNIQGVQVEDILEEVDRCVR